MAWKATGQPTVRKQRDKSVVRVDGIDTRTGGHRPRQLGTFLSQRSAEAAARAFRVEESSAGRGTVGWLVNRYVASRTDITPKAQQQYEWAAGHIESGLGAIPLATLDRDDITNWIEALAAGGRLLHHNTSDSPFVPGSVIAARDSVSRVGPFPIPARRFMMSNRNGAPSRGRAP